ncbi:3-keto-steroid reductase [Golovinomyces cichoracearum]|uniref:3-keto-steroid reductase n=1 Tax=Golovinomyces cichoracearum TaxID=62708 RepID=A0A420IBD3_9PEZI|nr:3-keto-steroid reductase [Golovinomyces cichoracearum]
MMDNIPKSPLLETDDGQIFALITGARGCLGYSIASRLLDEFLISSTSSLNKKLTLIICTRSLAQAQSSIIHLRAHLLKFLRSSQFAEQHRSWGVLIGKHYDWQDYFQRVRLIGVEVDLCDLRSIYMLADKLVNGLKEDYDYLDTDRNKHSLNSEENTFRTPSKTHQDVSVAQGCKGSDGIFRLPRIDVVIFTAGIGGWTGIDLYLSTKAFLFDTFEAVTRPNYNISRVGAQVKPQKTDGARNDPKSSAQFSTSGVKGLEEPPLGEVFCSNVFGHYLLAHELMPLLSQPGTSTSQYGGKIIWVSSIANFHDSFSFDDFQGLKSLAPYESSKRLIDLLVLPCEKSSVKLPAESFFDVSCTISGRKKYSPANAHPDNQRLVKPKNYVIHPGIFASDIMPLHFILALACKLIFYLVRWFGSPWHTINPYNAAIAPVRLALVDNEELNKMRESDPSMLKWGSATDSWGNAKIKKTEVPGWGWDGNVDTQPDAEMMQGRLRGSGDLRRETIEDFERLSARCWKYMEELRDEWEAVLGLKGSEV